MEPEQPQHDVNDNVAQVPEGPAGICNICGQETQFVGSDPALYREALLCSVCSSNSRYRSIARGLLRAIHEIIDVKAESLADLGNFQPAASLTIYDTQL